MKSKITRYKKYLPEMEMKFKRTITVLFVIDIERSKVREFVERMGRLLDETDFAGFDGSLEREVGSLTGVRDGGEDRFFPFNPCFFFTDYQTYKNVPIGDALTAKIYFWKDGNEWRLTNND